MSPSVPVRPVAPGDGYSTDLCVRVPLRRPGGSALGLDDEHAIRCIRAVQRGGRWTLDHLNRFDLVRAEIIEAARKRISSSTRARTALHPSSVHDHEGIVAHAEAVDAAKTQPGTGPAESVSGQDLSTRDARIDKIGQARHRGRSHERVGGDRPDDVSHFHTALLTGDGDYDLIERGRQDREREVKNYLPAARCDRLSYPLVP